MFKRCWKTFLVLCVSESRNSRRPTDTRRTFKVRSCRDSRSLQGVKSEFR
jgi:hypothetical protein